MTSLSTAQHRGVPGFCSIEPPMTQPRSGSATGHNISGGQPTAQPKSQRHSFYFVSNTTHLKFENVPPRNPLVPNVPGVASYRWLPLLLALLLAPPAVDDSFPCCMEETLFLQNKRWSYDIHGDNFCFYCHGVITNYGKHLRQNRQVLPKKGHEKVPRA